MSDFNQVLPTIDIVKTFIVILIIPIALKYFENQYLSEVAQKKNVWNNFIRTNGSIKDCFDKYTKVQKESECSIRFFYFVSVVSVISMFLILFLSTIMSISCVKLVSSSLYLVELMNRENITPNDLLLFFVSCFILLSSLISFYYFKKLQNCVFCVEDKEVLHKFSKVNKLSFTIILYSFILFLFCINILLYFDKSFNILIITAMCIFVISFCGSLLIKKQYTQRVKDNINNNYSRYFPYLEISTLGGKDIFGKLKNVFNSECIILNNGEEFITILWSSISTLKERRKNDFEGQKTLADFFQKHN